MTRLPATPLYYRLREVSELTGAPRATLYRRAKAGLLPYSTLGSADDSEKPTILLPRDAAQRLIDQLATDAARSVLPAPEQSRVRPIARAPRGRPRRSA